MDRIAFNSTATITGAFVLTYNPNSMELNDNTLAILHPTLDGAQIKHDKYFDSRPIIMNWVRIPNSLSGFTTMIGTLQSYVGTVKYVNYRDVDYRLTVTATWNKVRVANLEIKIEPGGSLKRNVTLTLLPEPE